MAGVTRPFALGLCFCLVTIAPAALAAEVPITEEARAHFSAGVSFLEDPDGARYDDAYREFSAAYAASPSWKILGNLGISAMKLERDGEAIDALSKYLSQGGKEIDRDERQQVERDLKTLQAGVAYVTLSFEPQGVTLTDERVPQSGSPVVNRYVPAGASMKLGVHPGHHRVTVELQGYDKAVWEVDAVAKQEQSHAFTLTRAPEVVPPPAVVAPAALPAEASAPPPEPSGGGNGLRVASFVALGVGVAGLGIGTVFALTASGKYSDANDMCPSFPCQLTSDDAKKREDLGKEADSAKTISLVGFIAGGVGVAAGATLFVLSSGKKQQQGLSVSPFVGVGSAGLKGSF
jgi:hypothetical protein